jgi:hypothetical protein
MGGLVEQAGGPAPLGAEDLARVRTAWESSMLHSLDRLRPSLQARSPQHMAELSRARWETGRICLTYWGRPVAVSFPALRASYTDDGLDLPTFDLAMLLFYLDTADGTPPTGRWIGYRELPGGLFYHQAFQGYSGDRLARAFGGDPAAFVRAGLAIGGALLPELGPSAAAFDPLPGLRLAAILWPGDEEFPARAAILFDAAAHHYLPTDGLALIGAGLTGRLLKANPPAPA